MKSVLYISFIVTTMILLNGCQSTGKGPTYFPADSTMENPNQTNAAAVSGAMLAPLR